MRKVITASASITLLSFVFIGSCWSRCEKLDEQDLIDVVVSRVIKGLSGEAGMRNPDGTIEALTYVKFENISDFYAAFPDCCSLEERGVDGDYPSFFQRLVKSYVGTVHVEYELTLHGSSGRVIENQRYQYFGVGKCGQIIEYS